MVEWFLYQDSLQSAKNQTRRRVFVHGGRGIGKTLFMTKLKERSNSVGDVPLVFINGRNPQQGRNLLQSLPGGEKPFHLIVDDLDLFLISGKKNAALLEDIVAQLMAVWSKVSGMDSRFFVSSTMSPSRLDHELQSACETVPALKGMLWEFFSDIGSTWNVISLSPWNRPWEEIFPEVQKNNSEEHYIEELTGGHPVLISPLLKALDSPEFKAIGDKKVSRAYLEDVIARDGLTRILRVVDKLRVSEPHAFEALVAMAVDPEIIPPEDIRGRLLEQALIYFNTRISRYEIPGALLKNRIKLWGRKEPGRSRVFLKPHDEDESRGYLVVQSATQEREEHPFAGKQWILLGLIAKKEGAPVSLSDIKEKLSIQSDFGARSLVQRVISKMTDLNAPVIKNVRKKGYCWSSINI